MRARIAINLATVFVLMATAGTGCRDESASPCPDGAAVQYPARNDDCVTIGEGLWGDVWFWDGDFAPVCASGSVTPAVREIRIHRLASLADVTSSPRTGFYEDVATQLVAAVQSDRFGFFEAALPPGTYSVFSVEDTLLYANRVDAQRNIFAVEVRAGQVTAVRFDITWRARF